MDVIEPNLHQISREDFELISRLKNNDTEAFSAIYFAHWESFLDICLGFLKEEELAKDVLHDVFLDFWRIRHKLEIKYSLRAYLSVCIKNKCIFVLKQQQKLKTTNLENLDFVTSEYDPLAVSDIEKQLDYILKNKLTKRSRIIFELNRFEDMTYKEIAAKMNLSVKSVEYHMSKVLSLLRKSILLSLTSILFF